MIGKPRNRVSEYHQTEVGVIPCDWRVVSISRFATTKTGPFGTLLKASEYCEHEGVPMISVGEIRNGYLRISEETPRIPANVVRRLPQFVLRAGDIVFGRKGGVDRSALIGADEDGWFLGSDGICVRPASDVSARYVAYQFRSERVQSWLLQHAIGTTMPSLNQAILDNVVVPIPPTLTEQEAIAEALGDADAWIESLERLVAKKRSLKQAAMQHLLCGRLCVNGNREMEGKDGLPHDWRIVPICEVAKLESGHTPSRREPAYWNGSIPWVSLHDSKDLDVREIHRTQLTVSELGLANSSARLLPKGTVIFSRTATVGKSTVLGRPMATSQDFANYVCGPHLHNHFLVALFRGMQDVWRSLMAGSTHNTIYMPAFKALKITLPPLDEQIEIAEMDADMETEIAAIEAKLAKARQVKQGMMHELLTGKTRLV